MWPMGWVVLFGIPISIYLVLLAIVLALRNPSKEVRYLVSISLMWLFIIAAWSYVTGWNKNLSFERYFALYALPPIGVWLGFVLWKWSKAG